MFKAIENWASQSDERSRLLIILIWMLFSVAVIGSVVVMAIIMLPGEYWGSPPQ